MSDARCKLKIDDAQIAHFTMHDSSHAAVDSWLSQMEDWASETEHGMPLRIIVDYSASRNVPLDYIARKLPKWVKDNERPDDPRDVHVAVLYRRHPLFGLARGFINSLRLQQDVRFFYDDEVNAARAWLLGTSD